MKKEKSTLGKNCPILPVVLYISIRKVSNNAIINTRLKF